MTKKHKYEDIPMKFWKDWLKSNEENRIAMVKKIFIARELSAYMSQKMKIKRGKFKQTINATTARMVNDYFQDLELALLGRVEKSTTDGSSIYRATLVYLRHGKTVNGTERTFQQSRFIAKKHEKMSGHNLGGYLLL